MRLILNCIRSILASMMSLKFYRRFRAQTTAVVLLSLLFVLGSVTRADPAPAASSNAYGLFGWLDHRSQYGAGVYPEPFIVDDSDLETGELRLDWIHQEKRRHVGDEVTAEIEKGFGELTIEVELHYERDAATGFNTATGLTDRDVQDGLGNIDLGARYPIHQYVSADGFIDNTIGVGIEVGVPSNTRISKQTEIVPKIFDDLRLGEHFTMQTVIGYSMLKGPGDHEEALEYGFVFGWTIQHNELPLPGVQQIVPVFEVAGEYVTQGEDEGRTNLVGNAAVRVNFNAVRGIQPRLGIGYVFPMNSLAREDFRWGVVASLVFEF